MAGRKIVFLREEQIIIKNLIKKDMISGTNEIDKLERIMVKLK